MIKPTLEKIGLYSEAATQLLLGTACVESKLGHYLKQINGPALGIYQIEPDTHKDVWENYLSYRNTLMHKVLALTSNELGWQQKAPELVSNLAYQTAIARVIYYRAKAPLPDMDDIDAMASYWKTYYNTALGKGTEEKFIESFKQLAPEVILHTA